MNTLGIALVWCAVQVTLVAIITACIYLAARKSSPVVRALVVQSSLAVFVLLAAFALSPWPRWWNPVPQSSSQTQPVRETAGPTSLVEGLADSVQAENGRVPSGNAASGLNNDDLQYFASAFWDGLRTELVETPAVTPSSRWRWTEILAALFLMGVALGLVRILLGLRSVHAFRHYSVAINDAKLLQLVDVVSAELGCRSKLEIRESAELATAATTGWLRPLIFLPVAWRNWSEPQCRVVLAHEISHINRHDFLGSLCAQIGLAVHFYHPLVHWLMRRLNLEQELAADAAAARIAGGQRPYLTILAEMALAQSDHRLSWPARTFLPTRGTFLRRIEMLRDTKHLTITSSKATRILAVGLLLLAGLAAVGLRAPDGADDALLQAAEPNRPQGTEVALVDKQADPATAATGIKLSYLPDDTGFIAVVRPAEILAQPQYEKLIPLLDQEFSLQQRFGISVAKIEQASVAMLGEPANDPTSVAPPQTERKIFTCVTIRLTEPSDFPTFTKTQQHNFEEQSIAGQTYFLAKNSNLKPAYFRPDDRTLVIGPEIEIVRMLTSGKKPKLVTDEKWHQTKGASAAFAMDGEWARKFARSTGGPVHAMFSPLFDETTSLVASLSLDEKLKLVVGVDCKSEAGAEKVRETVNALVVLGKNSMNGFREQAIGRTPRADLDLVLSVIGMSEKFMNSLKIEKKSSRTIIATALDFNNVAFMGLLSAQVSAARKAARRTQSKNNLKQLALAIHNYHDMYGHLPPAVVIGPDGKTPHSWRVELLPLLGQKDLYDQYRMDEPWDSAHNKQLIAKIPNLFHHPSDTSGKGHASYYALTGQGTIFDGKKGTQFQDIKDGLSNTILFVEAKQDIPWTKPEDIAYDPDKDPPKLGGFHLREGRYNAAFADGAIHFLTEEIPIETLKGLISKAGGEKVRFPN